MKTKCSKWGWRAEERTVVLGGRGEGEREKRERGMGLF